MMLQAVYSLAHADAENFQVLPALHRIATTTSEREDSCWLLVQQLKSELMLVSNDLTLSMASCRGSL